jgi:hypothetical protein
MTLRFFHLSEPQAFLASYRRCTALARTLEVDLAVLTTEQRNQISDRLSDGIEVRSLIFDSSRGCGFALSRECLIAEGPRLEDLLNAIATDQRAFEESRATKMAAAQRKAKAKRRTRGRRPALKGPLTL